MDAVERELAARGLDDLILGVLPGNVARRLYERRGFSPDVAVPVALGSGGGRGQAFLRGGEDGWGAASVRPPPEVGRPTFGPRSPVERP